ncbi:hypothetical protein J6590_047732 [Homalodisca vitripennis]|nr:hypothetical protein J6590_047732 [Homalodisca vitripennis]
MAVGKSKPKCGSCKKVVEDDSKSFLCEGMCDIWYHATCVDISDEEYDLIVVLGDKSRWFCDGCMSRIESLRKSDVCNDDYIKLKEMVSKLITYVKDITTDNIEINKKLDVLNSNFEQNLTSKQIDNVTEPKPETAISFANITANKSTITSVSQHRRITRSASKPHQFDQPTTSVGRSADMSITIPDTDQALSSACDVVNLTGEDLLTDQNGWKEVEGKKKKNKRNTGKGPADQPQSDGCGPTSPNVKNCDTKSIISAVKSAKPWKPQVLIGTAEAKTDCGLTGAKKAWFHIGKVSKNTEVKDVESFVTRTFPNIDFEIEKLDTKGLNNSFRIGVEYIHKDQIAQSSLWPKNITIKRFLFRRAKQDQLG